MLIEVTEEHIKYGKKCDPVACPVALAIASVIKDNMIAVGLNSVALVDRSTVIGDYFDSVDYELPAEAEAFILDFDADMDVKPFSFELEMEDDNVVDS